MKEEQLERLYSLGIQHGSLEMKNKILKALNRDVKMFRTTQECDLLIKILKKIDKIKV